MNPDGSPFPADAPPWYVQPGADEGAPAPWNATACDQRERPMTHIYPKRRFGVKNVTGLCVLIALVSWVTVELGRNDGAERIKRPVSARIEPKFKAPEPGEPIGNVIVKYSDGTEDAWTLKGNCKNPKVSEDGHVGWIVCELAADGKSLQLYNAVPIGSRLRICYRGRIVATLSPAAPFIEDWRFAPDGPHVVIKSRAAHGPATLERFTLRSEPAEAAVKAYEDGLPAWAEPFRE